MADLETAAGGDPVESAESRLSYKFQRLRERLRDAIQNGELVGKLPGERQLARRFRVNAKTLSKALTDLAAEGLLDRSIGRGTYVRSEAGNQAPEIERWLVIREEAQANQQVIEAFKRAYPQSEVVAPDAEMRPSFLSQFQVALNFAPSTPDSLLRALMVRNLSVIQVGHEPRTYSTHAVVIDRVLGVSLLARDMLLAGHTRFAVVEPRGQIQLTETVRAAGKRAQISITVDSIDAPQLNAAIEQGATAIICGNLRLANCARAYLVKRGIGFPGRVALGAVGVTALYPCSGYYVQPSQMVETIAYLARERSGLRPQVMWLTGSFVDANTMQYAVHPAAIIAQPTIPSSQRLD